MTQLVFLHGPGAGGCSEGYRYQLQHFKGSIAPDLPAHPNGKHCGTVQRYTEWVRGWLWAQGHTKDLVFVGFTLGACIALQYALDYPEEVKGLVLMSVAMRPKEVKPEIFSFRMRASQDAVAHEKWIESMDDLMHFIDPALRKDLIACHRKVGPRTQHDDLMATEQFDIRDRIGTLQPKLMLVHGLDDPLGPSDYEGEIHRAVPGSSYLGVPHAGHFPMAEQPAIFNSALEEFLKTLG